MVRPPRRRLTVVGAGYVGLVTGVGLAGLGHAVEIVETRADRLDALRAGVVPIHEAGLQAAFDDVRASGMLTVSDRPTGDPDAALVCVGTPIGPDGRSDLSQLRSALASLDAQLASGVPLVIRSTLPPGSTRRAVEWAGVPEARVLTNPEFLRQGTALHDFLHPSRIVVGRAATADPSTVQLVVDLFDGIEAPRMVVDIAAAELIKNGANAFLALKLSFTNEMSALAEAYGTDVDDVLTGITADPRIGAQHMRPSFGFGGSCLPKELQALTTAGRSVGLEMHVTTAAATANEAAQARFAASIEAAVDGLPGRRIALLGLAFKAGTDDVRDSPALGVARRLLEGGAEVRGYDPEASANAARMLPALVISPSVAAAVADADAVAITTEWPEFRDLDWQALAPALRRRIVVDGRRLLDPARMRACGFRYERIGDGTATPVAAAARDGTAAGRDETELSTLGAPTTATPTGR